MGELESGFRMEKIKQKYDSKWNATWMKIGQTLDEMWIKSGKKRSENGWP